MKVERTIAINAGTIPNTVTKPEQGYISATGWCQGTDEFFIIRLNSSLKTGDVELTRGTIIVLNKDLFFGVKIGNILRSQGYSVVFAKTSEIFSDLLRNQIETPLLGIIDINAGVNWYVVSDLAGERGPGIPILAFGSHLDVEGLKAAKAAGVRRTVSNGDFHRDMVALVERYAKPFIDGNSRGLPV